MVLADETVLCFLYDDFSATDLGTKAVTKVPQRAGVWLRAQTSHTLFQATCRTLAYQHFPAKAHTEHVVCTTPCTSLSAEQTATIFRTSNATRAALGGLSPAITPRNLGPCGAYVKTSGNGTSPSPRHLPPHQRFTLSFTHSISQSIKRCVVVKAALNERSTNWESQPRKHCKCS